MALDRIELTESGGGGEPFAVTNEGARDANLQGFSLRAVGPETGEVDEAPTGVEVN